MQVMYIKKSNPQTKRGLYAQDTKTQASAVARVPLPLADLHHRDGVGRRVQQGGGAHARLRVRPAVVHAAVRLERTDKEDCMKLERMTLNLDRAQLDKAMKKAAGEGVDMKVAGNQSALVRALVEAYLGREGA